MFKYWGHWENYADLSLKIYNIAGELIKTLLETEEASPPRTYPQTNCEIDWDGRNDKGLSVASGVYLLVAKLSNFDYGRGEEIKKIKKIVILK